MVGRDLCGGLKTMEIVGYGLEVALGLASQRPASPAIDEAPLVDGIVN
jgi:hypothetical protein